MNTKSINLKVKYSDLYNAFDMSSIEYDKAKFEYILNILNNMPIEDVHEIKSEITAICWIALSLHMDMLSDAFIIECINNFYWKLALTNYTKNTRLRILIDKCRNDLSINTLNDIEYINNYEIEPINTTDKVE